MKTNINTTLKKLLIDVLELDFQKDELGDAAMLDEHFGLDSVAAIEFILGIEKEFQITIDPETISIDLLRDLDKLSVYIKNRLDDVAL